MQNSLSTEEYENILNHINSYVQTLVDIKIQEQGEKDKIKRAELNSKQTQLIVQIIKENLETMARQKRSLEEEEQLMAKNQQQLNSYQLNDADINLLVQRVIITLEQSDYFQRPLQFSKENLEQIERLIHQTVEINNHSHYNLLVEQLDVDALLKKLLQAPLFNSHIDEQLSQKLNAKLQEKLAILEKQQREGSGGGGSASAMDRQEHMLQQKLHIDKLNEDIAFIKLSLQDKLSENEDLHYSIGQLRETQQQLLKRLQDFELTTDDRFAQLWQEISVKLNSLQNEQFKLLNQQVKLSLIEILGFKSTTAKDVEGSGAASEMSEIDLRNWIQNMFVAKDYLEQRLNDINNRTNNKIVEEIDRSGMLLMRDISDRLKKEILMTVEVKHKENSAVIKGQIQNALSEQEIRGIVKSVLAIYDADKTGLVDFALESAGGQILSTRCTESYQTKTAQISVFGIPLWYPTNTPRVAISPNVQPGECWAFQGFPGFLVLKLNSLVYVTGFTLEHIPKSLAPNNRIDSAPRNFTVWGLEHEKDQEPILFGKYEYADNDASLQYFPLQNKNIKRPYEIVELRIESNHGHPLYTCLYRFRVHGKPPAA